MSDEEFFVKITKITDVEDCFADSLTKEVTFEKEITKDFINYLGIDSNLEYYADFPKPFYKVEKIDKYVIKGVESFQTLKIILYKKNMDEVLKEFIAFIEKFN